MKSDKSNTQIFKEFKQKFAKKQDFRTDFMTALGAKFASNGAMYLLYYTDAREAFDKAQTFAPYGAMFGSSWTEADFVSFESGFNSMKAELTRVRQMINAADEALRTSMQKAKLHAPNYIYADKEVEHYTDLQGWQADNPHVTPDERASMKAQMHG